MLTRLPGSARWMAAVAALLLIAPAVSGAQRLQPRLVGRPASAVTSGSQARTSSSAGDFAFEAAAGALGSLAGIGLTALVSDCGMDDLGCIIKTVGTGGLLGAIGATAAASFMARQLDSPRSVTGAALGAVLGTGVGLGVHYVLNSGSDRNLGDALVVPIFVVSQGVFAAIGSRILGSR